MHKLFVAISRVLELHPSVSMENQQSIRHRNPGFALHPERHPGFVLLLIPFDSDQATTDSIWPRYAICVDPASVKSLQRSRRPRARRNESYHVWNMNFTYWDELLRVVPTFLAVLLELEPTMSFISSFASSTCFRCSGYGNKHSFAPPSLNVQTDGRTP